MGKTLEDGVHGGFRRPVDVRTAGCVVGHAAHFGGQDRDRSPFGGFDIGKQRPRQENGAIQLVSRTIRQSSRVTEPSLGP